uniref:Uncharacterized protein LOC105043584 n=1 Tax=Elaeis guineensis var. tenera TaxID=51953 RepID=A0A6I9R2N7_ELAGV|nr:uncharacterized protein LOC105043584 [Elaeis guineensis]
MQQRKVAVSGRPSGTDGSDFSYRMVVDSRYTKVAKGKSRLRALIAAQTVNQVIGSLWAYLTTLQVKNVNSFAVLSTTIGFISLIIGEVGRRRSRANLLRLYMSMSSIATAFAVACMVRSEMFLKVVHNHNISAMSTYELIEALHVLLSMVLQIFVIITTVTLVQNMSTRRVP